MMTLLHTFPPTSCSSTGHAHTCTMVNRLNVTRVRAVDRRLTSPPHWH
jgi:hypothetical protein